MAGIDVVHVNSVRFKHVDSSCYFPELNLRGLFNFLIDGDIESTTGPTQNGCKSPDDVQRKLKVFEGTPEKADLGENINRSKGNQKEIFSAVHRSA